MKKILMAVLAVMLVFAFFGCRQVSGGKDDANQTPVADDFNISGIGTVTYDGMAKTVTVTAKAEKTTGTVTVKYNGSTTAPSAVGTYTVTFDVTASAGWDAASGLNAGTLSIDGSPSATYIIIESGPSFTATKNNITVGTGTIDTVITAIKTDANGANIEIQFGNSGGTLNIGATGIVFNNTGGAWGLITLSGKITSSGTTITLADTVSISITDAAANIKTTSVESSINALRNNGTGTITISGGSFSGGKAGTHNDGTISNSGAGTLTISGGTFENIYNSPDGTAIINSGTFTGGILNAGILTINNCTIQTSELKEAVVNTSTGTITIANGTIKGGGTVIRNLSGTVTVNGGTIESTGENGTAIYNQQAGCLLTVTGGTITASVGAYAEAIGNDNDSTVIITGGTIESTTGYAIRNAVRGTVTIIGNGATINGEEMGTVNRE